MSRKKKLARATVPTTATARTPTAPSRAMDVARVYGLVTVLVFLLFAWVLSSITPLADTGSYINAPDERAHVGYVAAIALGHRLPTKGDREFPTYQWHQPPFYYAVAAPAYQIGLRAMRAVSILFAIVSLWALWAAASVVLSGRPAAIALATGIVCLLPMRQAVMAAVGNESATECVFSLTLYCLTLILCRGVSRSRVVMLTVLLTVGLLTKATCLLLLPSASLAMFLASRRAQLSRRVLLGLVPVLFALALASPWYVRNARLYGEILPLRAFHEEFAATSRATDWIGKQELEVNPWTGDLQPGPLMTRAGYVSLLANWTIRTFFAAYTPPSKQAIGAPVFMPPSAYAVFLGILLAGLLSALWHASLRRTWKPKLVSLAITLGLSAALVSASFAAFTAMYFQAQGRYLYPALLPLSLAWADGMERLAPERYKWHVVVGILVTLVVLCAAFAFAYVAPAYRP